MTRITFRGAAAVTAPVAGVTGASVGSTLAVVRERRLRQRDVGDALLR